MPSFLSKVFGRKKADDKEPTSKRASAGSLLEGKFEAVPPNVSPSAALFPDPQAALVRGKDKAKEKEPGLPLFRQLSRPKSPPIGPEKRITDVPHLSLKLPIAKEERNRALGVVFEADPDAFAVLNGAALGERRVTPLEALVLMRACSQVIVERGLETLGIMHPHWYSASPEVQHRLISLYILSLTSNNPTSTLSPGPAATTSAFESELTYSRSLHDVAAVLRWGLRHLKLDGDSFGKDTAEWAWYDAFAAAERTAAYPAKAFSNSLVPQLPPAHCELLFTLLDIISSLAAHGEANGFSGSRLSKFLGLWLLTSQRSSDSDDWNAFYARWERAGRILEHLFLARIRDDAASQKMPRRLTELVEQYPYAKYASSSDDGLLPRPRFTTRSYDALYVRLETEYTGASKPKSHPLRLIAEALRSASETSEGEAAQAWQSIKKESLGFLREADRASSSRLPIFSNVFADETIRLLSLIPADSPEKAVPTFALLTTTSREQPTRKRSFSLPDSPRSPTENGHGKASSSGHAPPSMTVTATAPTTASPETPTDWLQFSSQGFALDAGPRNLASTLWDNDLEVTSPPEIVSRKSSSRRRSVDRSRRSSVDNPSPVTPAPPPPPPLRPTSKSSLVARIKLDEAFIDFWSDALLDPISATWPKFVICQLKPLPGDLTVSWLVVEQQFTRPPPPPEPKSEPISELPTTPTSPTSPRASVSTETSRLSSTFSSTKKRFGFFTSSSVASGTDSKSAAKNAAKTAAKKKASKVSKVGELGEIVKEEEEVKPATFASKEGATLLAAAGVAAATAGAGAVAAGEIKADVASSALPSTPKEPTAALETVEVPKDETPPVTADPAQNGAAHEDEAVVAVPADANGDILPPAPPSVVSAGNTPGPQVALASSEPVTIAQATADVVVAAPVEATPEANPLTVAEAPATEAETTISAVSEPTPAESVPPVVEGSAPVVEPPFETHIQQPAISDVAPAAVEGILVEEVKVESEPLASESVAPAEPAVEEPVAAVEVDAEPGPVVEVDASTVQEEEVPVVEEVAVVDEASAVDEVHIVEASPTVEEVPVFEDIPVVEETPATEEVTTVEKALAVKEALAAEEVPIVEEVPLVEEVPVVDEAAAVVAPEVFVAEALVSSEESTILEEASTVEQTPVAQEVPLTVETPTVEEIRATKDAAAEEATTVEEDVPAVETPALEEPSATTTIVTEDAEDLPAQADIPAVEETQVPEVPASFAEPPSTLAEDVASASEPAVEAPSTIVGPSAPIAEQAAPIVEELTTAPSVGTHEPPAAEEPTPSTEIEVEATAAPIEESAVTEVSVPATSEITEREVAISIDEVPAPVDTLAPEAPAPAVAEPEEVSAPVLSGISAPEHTPSPEEATVSGVVTIAETSAPAVEEAEATEHAQPVPVEDLPSIDAEEQPQSKESSTVTEPIAVEVVSHEDALVPEPVQPEDVPSETPTAEAIPETEPTTQASEAATDDLSPVTESILAEATITSAGEHPAELVTSLPEISMDNASKEATTSAPHVEDAGGR